MTGEEQDTHGAVSGALLVRAIGRSNSLLPNWRTKIKVDEEQWSLFIEKMKFEMHKEGQGILDTNKNFPHGFVLYSLGDNIFGKVQEEESVPTELGTVWCSASVTGVIIIHVSATACDL